MIERLPRGRVESTESAETIRVFIVDDHPVVRQGLRSIIDAENDLSVCGQSGTIGEALEGISATLPQVLLVDLNLDHQSGLDLLDAVQQSWVGLKSIVVSQHEPIVYAGPAIKRGAQGYVCKDEAVDHVVHAIRAVYDGGQYFSPRASEAVE
jgi:DNA-binding NarL/FixJ family response regulator